MHALLHVLFFVHIKLDNSLPQSLMTGLMVHRPLDHIGFIIDCLKQLRQTEDLNWDTFIRDDFADRTRSDRRSARGSRPSSSTFREERPPSLRKCATLPPVRTQKTVPNLGEEKRPGTKSYSKQRPLASISSISAIREVNNIPATRNVVFVLGMCVVCVIECASVCKRVLVCLCPSV